jgi:predicted GNAT superfamily acetyltransferase
MPSATFTVRACNAVEEFERMVDLQLRVWGYSELDACPSILFVVAAKTGGQVIGAFDQERMIGFAFLTASRIFIRTWRPCCRSIAIWELAAS